MGLERERLPEVLHNVLFRERIPPSEASIGLHFRNRAEIEDIGNYIDHIHKSAAEIGTEVLALGLTGSRIYGEFAYSPKKFFRVKLLPHGHTEAGMSIAEDEIFGLAGQIPGRILEDLTAFTNFLKDEQQRKVNLSDIDLTALPDDIPPFAVRFRRNIPDHFVPDTTTDHSGGAITPKPAFFFPDINLVAITNLPTVEVGEIVIIGEQSGVAIHLVSFSRAVLEDPDNSDIVQSHLKRFRGLQGFVPQI